MEQLSGLDTAFVSQDSTRTPMHICAVLLYDAGNHDQNRLSLASLRDLTERRLSSFPLFKRKLLQVPMGVDAPYWVDEPESQWRRAIGEDTLPAEAAWPELFQLLDRLHGQRMDLARPLWQMRLIHGLTDFPGLPKHCQALMVKIHHAAIDGVSMGAVIAALHTGSSESIERPDTPQRAPSQLDIWRRANLNSFGRQIKLADTVRNLLPGVLRARDTRRKFTDLPRLHRGGARFNSAVTARRSTGSVLLALDEVIAIKRAVRRVTLNDIAMCCVSGALRRYLAHHRQLPAQSLAAGVPVNLRSRDDASAGGNKIATMVVGLATDVDDPVKRLRLIHRYAVAGKKQIDALGSGTIMDISDSLSPGVLAGGLRTMALANQMVDVPVPFHTMISNVPGPQQQLELLGAKLLVPLGLGPVRDNMGLFHIVSSGLAKMSISFVACARLLPDSEFYQSCLADAVADLYQAAMSEARSAP
jgi:diacylglycerol O-acyltransferase